LAAVAAMVLGCGGRSFQVQYTDGGGDDGGASDAPVDVVTGEDVVDTGVIDTGVIKDVVVMDEGPPDNFVPPTCPIPATITEGGACTTPGLLCSSAAPIYACGGGQVLGYAQCTCLMGKWSCPPAACIDAGGPPPNCPAPSTVHQGGMCTYPWAQCNGNPMNCGGSQTFYDVLSCKGMTGSAGFVGTWETVVATQCADH
jgi:hypothetical protein